MPQKRKRIRRKLRFEPILVLAVLIVFVTGILYSPITSVTKVTAVGVRPSDRPQVDAILASLEKIPWIKVNGRAVETEVQRIQGIETANYSQIIFGRGRLEVKYRTPVARVRAEKPIGIDAKGVVFVTDALPANLPLVVRSESARELPLTVAGGYPAGSVAELAVEARKMFPKDELTIWFNGKGALCLTVGKGLVVLGSSEDLAKKLRTLEEVLTEQPDLLTKLESLNLTEPSHPVKTYKKQRE